MKFQKIIVYKIPPGGRGVYSQLKAYKLLCSNEAKVYFHAHIDNFDQTRSMLMLVRVFLERTYYFYCQFCPRLTAINVVLLSF